MVELEALEPIEYWNKEHKEWTWRRSPMMSVRTRNEQEQLSTERRLGEHFYNEVDIEIVENLRGDTLINRGHIQLRAGRKVVVADEADHHS